MANQSEKPPQVNEEKKPHLFYFEDAVNAWVPVPVETEKAILAEFWDGCLDEGDEIELQIRRHDMTDAEFDAIPEE